MDTAAVTMLGLFAFLTVGAWASNRRAQREMELRYELYRLMVEHPGPEAEAVRALLAKDAQQRQEAASAGTGTGGPSCWPWVSASARLVQLRAREASLFDCACANTCWDCDVGKRICGTAVEERRPRCDFVASVTWSETDGGSVTQRLV